MPALVRARQSVMPSSTNLSPTPPAAAANTSAAVRSVVTTIVCDAAGRRTHKGKMIWR